MLAITRWFRSRALLLLVVVACRPTPVAPAPDAIAPIPKQPDSIAPPSGAWHVGLLSQRGTPDCTGGEQHWLDVEPRIGDTPIAPLSDEEATWLDHPVVAHGHGGPAPSARAATTVVAPCPIAQARSDWEFTPRGLRIVRGGGSNHPYFDRDAMRPLVELTLHDREGRLVVDFRNPVPVDLVGVEIRVHYEGCRGKPGTTSKAQEIGAMASGAGVQARFDRVVEASRGAMRAYSVQVVASGPEATFDLDVPLGALGVTVECPDRE